MGHWDDLRHDKEQILDVRREEATREGPIARLITHIGDGLAHPLFFLAAVTLHLAWVLANMPGLSPFEPWDPPPFDLLSTIASVEAPLLALLILMRQQQDRRVQELREEIDVQTTLHVERETSAILRLLSGLRGRRASALSRVQQRYG